MAIKRGELYKLQISLTEEVYLKLLLLMEKEKRTESQMGALLIEEALKAYEQG